MYRFLFVILSIIIFSTVQVIASEELLENKEIPKYAIGVNKKSDYLYTGQRKDGVYFVMERIDAAVPNSEKRLNFWDTYISSEYNKHGDYRCLWANKNGILPKGFLTFSSRDASLTDGIYSLRTSLEEFYKDNELWIGCACIKDIKDPADLEESDIEMLVSVMTHPDAPIVEHMGISKSFRYLLNAYYAREEYPLHTDLSMSLHSFAAKIMNIRYDNKIYMITAPVPAMRNIMINSLPKDDLFIILAAKE